MYAVIKTGGKQYRVQPGDLLVVEKLAGDVGAEVSFDQVLMVGGEGGDVTVGAPVIEGALVRATLVETRKGEKIKIFKKIRRQGYRRTRGHRQEESVLRVTGLEAAGQTHKWDGTVDLTPRSELQLRARNLASRNAAAGLSVPAPSAPAAEAHVETVVQDVDGPTVTAAVVETNAPDVAAEAPAKKPRAPRKPKAAPEGEA